MRTLLAAAAAALAFGCGPDAELTDPTAQQTAALDEVVEPALENPMRLEIVNTEQGLIFRLVQDPVEERFFVPVDVTQPPPAMPPPPCPTCR